jgi:hypothetical protein
MSSEIASQSMVAKTIRQHNCHQGMSSVTCQGRIDRRRVAGPFSRQTPSICQMLRPAPPFTRTFDIMAGIQEVQSGQTGTTGTCFCHALHNRGGRT